MTQVRLQHSAVIPSETPASASKHRRAAQPRLAEALCGSALWATAVAAGVGYGLYAAGWEEPDHIRLVLILYLAGAFAAFPVSLLLARLVSSGRPRQVAFSAFFLCLGCLTIGSTAAIYALYYRVYYAQWHAEPFSTPWLFQFGFTVAGALYQFAVLGLRLYFPLGLAALFVASIWFARRSR